MALKQEKLDVEIGLRNGPISRRVRPNMRWYRLVSARQVKYACLCSFIYIDKIKMALNFNDMNYNLIV